MYNASQYLYLQWGCGYSIFQNFPFGVKVRKSASFLEVGVDLVIHRTETSVGTGTGFFGKQYIHVSVFGDVVGALVDSFATELCFVTETVVGLAT